MLIIANRNIVAIAIRLGVVAKLAIPKLRNLRNLECLVHASYKLAMVMISANADGWRWLNLTQS